MICISIAQESRRLALADMLNASSLGADLLEVRLDAFEKAPDISDLLQHRPRPVILSCRRFADGGRFQGPESERLALLRQCIISRADYVEIELDAADQIRRLPPTQRVISYTNLSETPADIGEIYEECLSKQPDVVKLVTLARTPEEAWPLLQIVARQRVPTVAVGLGKPGVMLSLLGKKLGAPWVHAALEKGMEAYPGQASIGDLRTIYRYDDIDAKTRLLGVAGFTELQTATIAALNSGIAAMGISARCLPLAIGSVELFRKVIDAVKLAAVVVDAEHQESLRAVAGAADAAAESAGGVDLLLHKEDHWQGVFTLHRAALQALESALLERRPGANPLAGRMVMVVGINPAARALLASLRRRQALAIVASRDRAAAQALAQQLDCRHAQFEAIYSTMHDVLIVCRDEPPPKPRPDEPNIHPGYLKANMAVMDLTGLPRSTWLLEEAARRGCTVVSPRTIVLNQWAMQLRLMAGKEPDPQRLAEGLDLVVPEQ